MDIKKVVYWGGLRELSEFLLGSVITVFTWISKYITWISKQYTHFYAFYLVMQNKRFFAQFLFSNLFKKINYYI